ncbi:OmpA family protein, partial [Leptolyngbya cf. ectocarpi LEGE 11479]
STADVESRLTTFERQLTPKPLPPSATLPASPPTPDTLTSTPNQSAPKPSQPLLETTELKINLPSDALFAPGEARLLATAPELLKSIFEDLAQYPNATILIGSHTDNHLEISQSVTLAFQQANTLKAYLAGNLPDHRWVTIGYGQSQPVADNSNPHSSQRNRRIEIAIDRR